MLFPESAYIVTSPLSRGENGHTFWHPLCCRKISSLAVNWISPTKASSQSAVTSLAVHHHENISTAIADGAGMLLGADVVAWLYAHGRTRNTSELLPRATVSGCISLVSSRTPSLSGPVSSISRRTRYPDRDEPCAPSRRASVVSRRLPSIHRPSWYSGRVKSIAGTNAWHPRHSGCIEPDSRSRPGSTADESHTSGS